MTGVEGGLIGVRLRSSPGGADVHNHRLHLCHLLVALPPLLRVRVPQQKSNICRPRPDHLLGHLLAGHV